MSNEWGRFQGEADAFSDYEDRQFQEIGARSEAMRREFPGAKGWASPPFKVVASVPVPTTPYRIVDERWTHSGCIAIQAQGLARAAIDGATFLNVTLRGMRQSALLTRNVQVFAWGMAFPFSAGQVQVDVQVGPGPLVFTPGQQVLVWASLSIGVPVQEDLPTFDQVIGATPILLQPPDFARTMTITVLSGGPITAPIPLAAGASATMSAFPRTLNGPAGTHCSITWGVLSP